MTPSSPIPQPMPLTVVILTLNEEVNLPDALASVKGWAKDVFVVDSLSADRTVDVALDGGAQVVQRPFTNYGDQWNWALDHLPIATPWVFKLDADERVSSELKAEVAAVLSRDPKESAFVVPIRLWFMGKPMHPGLRVTRLWRRAKARFSDVIVNEHLVVTGPSGRMRHHIEHVDTPDLHGWYDKQNRYTTMEAIMRARGDALAARPRLFGTPLERRMFFKRVFYHLPLRYPALFVYHWLFCGAWRDGSEGWSWARLRTELYRTIDLKTREIRRTGRVPQVPTAPHGDYDPRVLATGLQQNFVSDSKS